MSIDTHLLAWAAFTLLVAAYLWHLVHSGRTPRKWEPLVLITLFLLVLLGPIKFKAPTENANHQASQLEWEMQQRIAQPLPDRVVVAPRPDYQDRIALERSRDVERTQGLRQSLIEDTE